MNANELAEELLAVVNVSSHVKMCASDMLRRQQAEIERLTTKNLEWLANWNEQQAEIEALKAHPVKELTDEEIIDIWLPFIIDGIQGKIDFARAILRKAQEK